MATAICGSAHRAAPDQLQGCAKTRDVLGQSPLPRKQALADLPCRHRLLCLKSLRSSVDAHRPSQPLDEERKDLRQSRDRKSTRLNSSHTVISYAVFCLKKKNRKIANSQIVTY